MPRREDVAKVDVFVSLAVWDRLERFRRERRLAHELRMQMAAVLATPHFAFQSEVDIAPGHDRAKVRFTFECEAVQLQRFAELAARQHMVSRQRALNELPLILANRSVV